MACLILAFVACEKVEPDFFDEGANGAYFDYNYAADYDKRLNFSDYIVGRPDTAIVTLRVKLLGYLYEGSRTLAVKVKPIDGYPLADVVISEVTFVHAEYEKDIEVKVCRPEKEDSIYAVCIYLDGSGDIGTGIAGKDEINLFVLESYEQPSVWYSHMDTYLGSWSREKHLFLAQHTGDNHFYASLYDANIGMHDYDAIVALNVSAVNALLAQAPSEPIVVDLPIIPESERPAYSKPYFWDTYEPYLGMYRANKFCRFTHMLGGSTTRDIAALYASEAGMQKMEEESVEFHKGDVLEMLNEYYRYAEQGIAIGDFKSLCWVPMQNDINYTMRIPYWWDDPQGLGTADIVKHYFGEYNADKYQFMLKTLLKEDGVENFIAASLLPFIYDAATGTYNWDSTPLGTKQLAGEERLKECYRLIKAANDKRPPSRRFDIPKVELEN